MCIYPHVVINGPQRVTECQEEKNIQLLVPWSLFSRTWRIENIHNIWLQKYISLSGATRSVGFFGHSVVLVPGGLLLGSESAVCIS